MKEKSWRMKFNVFCFRSFLNRDCFRFSSNKLFIFIFFVSSLLISSNCDAQYINTEADSYIKVIEHLRSYKNKLEMALENREYILVEQMVGDRRVPVLRNRKEVLSDIIDTNFWVSKYGFVNPRLFLLESEKIFREIERKHNILKRNLPDKIAEYNRELERLEYELARIQQKSEDNHFKDNRSPQRFSSPTFEGTRLDWCYSWGSGCGAEAANAFCREEGFSGAAAWAIDADIGSQITTKVISSGKECKESYCDGFKYIECK